MKFKNYIILSLVGLLVFCVFAGAFFGGASAVSLKVTSAYSLSQQKKAACTPQTLAASIDIPTLRAQIKNIPVECQNKVFTLRISASIGSAAKTVSAVPTGSTLTFPDTLTLPATIIGVKLVVDGWHVPVSWTGLSGIPIL